MRSADNESSGGVNEELGVSIYHFSGDDGIKYILFDVGMDLLLGNILVMLGGAYDSLEPYRLSVLVVLYRNLSLSVGS